MAFTATARRVGGGLRHEVDVNGRHSIVTDEPIHMGGTDLGPAPHELVPAALASCVSTMVSLYAMRKGWRIGEVVAEVDYDAEARTASVTLHLCDGLTDDQITRLTRVANTCPVRRALEGGFAFDERVRTDRPCEPAIAA